MLTKMRWGVVAVLVLVPAATLVAGYGYCRISVAGLNQQRFVPGWAPLAQECGWEEPGCWHSPPFGNWGVDSNYGCRADGAEFVGWHRGECNTVDGAALAGDVQLISGARYVQARSYLTDREGRFAIEVPTEPSAGVAQPQRQPEPIEVHWKELPRVVMGRRVAVLLADGTQLEGKVRRINPADLVLEITKTSAPHAYPKGVTTIPCEAVSTLQVKQRRWRIAGTLIGLGGGLAAGWMPIPLFCGDPDRSAACTWTAWFVITGISAIVGYVAGRSPDQRAGRVRRVTCGGAPAAGGTLSEVSEAGKLDWRSRCGQKDLGEEHCY